MIVRMEGLRVYPPVPMTLRKSKKDQVLDGIMVPKETLFYIPVSDDGIWFVFYILTETD